MGLREQSLRGGAYLVVREGVGMSVRLGGVVLLTRLIGPAAYGVYAAGFAVTTALSTLAWFGVDTYLIRHEGEIGRPHYDQAFWLLLAQSTLVSAVGIVGAVLAAPWLRGDGYLAPLLVMTALIPVKVLWTPAQAQLERGLRYRRMAGLELSADVLHYAVALLLAVRGAGVWAAVAGFAAWQTWLLAGSYALAGYRPRWAWSGPLARDMLSYGTSYSSSVWLERCRDLVPALVLGRFLGPEAIGYASLTIRITEALTFGRKIVRRVSLVAVGRVQEDPARMRTALQEGVALQTLAVAPFLGGFALVAPVVVPVAFGGDWEPVVELYPFVALAYLCLSAATMHRTTLYVLRRNLQVTRFFAVHVALLAGSGALLVPRFGLVGYGYAEVVALGAYVLLVRDVARAVPFDHRPGGRWLLVAVPPLFGTTVGLPWALALWLPAIALAAAPGTRHQLRGYVRAVRSRSASRPA